MALYLGDKLIASNLAGGDTNPIGSVIAFAGSNAPVGYLMCDGSAVSRETYADLFAVIGTTYGSGDGTTTFNLPNFKEEYNKLLWTNSNPTSAFDEQTISIDLSAYGRVYIEFFPYAYTGQYDIVSHETIPVGKKGYLHANMGASGTTFGNFYAFRRDIEATSSGVVFSAVYGSVSGGAWSVYANKTGCVPYRIYGITQSIPIIKAKQLISVMETGLADDFVVEEGTDGDWEYRKWNSGALEISGETTFSNVTFSTAGNLYRSSELSVTYPSTFPSIISKKRVLVNLGSYSALVGAGSWDLRESGREISGYIFRLNSNSQSIRATFYLIGRWK